MGLGVSRKPTKSPALYFPAKWRMRGSLSCTRLGPCQQERGVQNVPPHTCPWGWQTRAAQTSHLPETWQVCRPPPLPSPFVHLGKHTARADDGDGGSSPPPLTHILTTNERCKEQV